MIRAFGGFFFLLAHEVRLMFRIARDRQRKGAWIVLLLLAGVLLATGYFAAWGLSMVSPSLSRPLLITVTAVIAPLAAFMFGHALIAVTDAIYTRDDLDLLLSSPFSPWTVLVVRMLGVALRVGGTYLVMLSGIAVWLVVFGAYRWLSPLAGTLGLALISTAFGILVALALFYAIGPRATRRAAQVLGTLIGASFFIYFQIHNLSGGDPSTRWRAVGEFLKRLDLPATSPFLLPARAFMGDAPSLAIWTAAAILIFAGATYLFASRFVDNAAAVLALGPKRKKDAGKIRPMRGGAIASVVRKEFRLIGRDPVLLSQILLQIIYLVFPLAYLFYRSLSGGEGPSGVMIAVLAGVFAALGSSIAGALAWIVISAEDAPDLVAASPVSRGSVEVGKVLAASLPVILGAAAAMGGLAFLAPKPALWTFVGVSAAALSATLIGLWHQRPGSRKDFRRRPGASWSSMLGQGMTAMAWSTATSLAAAGLAIVAIIPAIIALGLLAALHESRREA